VVVYIRIKLHMIMPNLRVWFYNPTNDDQGVVNKIVARIDPPFCHTEIQFTNNDACSIYMGSEVILRERKFESPNYTCVRVPCTASQETAARAFATNCVDQKQQFSTLHMSACMIWTDAFEDPSKTFCSKLVYEILLHAGIMPTTSVGRGVSPSALHRLLIANRAPVVVSTQKSVAIGFKIA